MKQKLGVDPELVQGTGGVFDVAVGGTVVAKRSLAGFPGEEEIVSAVKEALGK